MDLENWKMLQLLAPEELRPPEVALVGIEDTKTSQQQTQLQNLLQRNQDIFASSDEDLGRTDIIRHQIETGYERPIKQRAYRTSYTENNIIQQEIDKMLRQGIIRPSISPWSSPVVLVKKKNGETRFCVNYRKLNQITKKDNYPLPRIDELLDDFGKAKWFSTLDLKSGYWQVEMNPADQAKTAFITRHGTYEYLVMPFGLTNAPATF